VSEDGLRMKFFLRRGVEFSDGEPLDADDVLFTFNWIRNEAVAADRDRAFLTKLKDVTKIDDLTVEFTFSEFYYLNFSTIAGTSIMAEHFYSRFKPQEFNEKTGLLIGSGPYRLQNPETWTPGQPVEIVRNDRYWGEPPTFDRIVYKEIQGESTEMVIYGNQNHDIIRCTPAMYEKLLADQRVMAFSNHLKYPSIYKGFLYCGWNQARRQDGKDVPTLFADKRVRRAMTMLVDRERMAKDIFRDYYTVASGPFAPQSPQSDPNVKAWPYDEAGAKALLKEVGFEDRNRDGVLEGPDGKQQFRFKLVYPSGNESWEKVVLFMKDNYARAGIILEPDKLDWPVMVQRLNEGDFEAITLGWSSSPESDPYQIYHSDAMKGQGDNRTHYSNPELDRTIDQARTTVDKAARMKLWQQVHRILHEDQPYTFLFNRPELRLWNNRIQNVVPSTVGLNYEQLNGGVIPWFVPSDKQRYTQ
jgi:peptide/nickel transport system substrate-binding protein